MQQTIGMEPRTANEDLVRMIENDRNGRMHHDK